MAGEPLDQLELARHRDMRGRGRRAHGRLVARLALCVLPVLALLNVFGQRASTTMAAGDGGAVEVHVPEALRGGLFWQSSITIRARADLPSPRIVFSPDWLQGMTLNTIEPSPEDETSDGGALAFGFSDMKAGDALKLVMHWQVNPTSTGHRDFDVTLKDGDRTIAVVRRDLQVWP